MSFGSQVHHHRFYNKPSSKQKFPYEEYSDSRYQSTHPKSLGKDIDESMISMKESYLKHVNSPNILKRDQLGYQSVKFNKDIVDRFACDFMKDNQVLQKFRKQAEQMKRNKKYQHVNSKSKYQLLPILHSQPLSQNFRNNFQNSNKNITEINPSHHLSQIARFQTINSDRNQAQSHINKINLNQQDLQQDNAQIQQCDVGINTKLDDQNKSIVKKKKQMQKKFHHQKKEKEKFKKKYESLKKKILQGKIKGKKPSRSAFQLNQQRDMLQSEIFTKELTNLSQLIKDVSSQLQHNNQILKQRFNNFNSLKLPSFQRSQSIEVSSLKQKNPEQSFYKQLQKIPQKQNQNIKLKNLQIQAFKTKYFHQQPKNSRVTRFKTQNLPPQIKEQKQQQMFLPKIVYTGNKKSKFDALKLLKKKLQQNRPQSLSSFDSKRSKTQYY